MDSANCHLSARMPHSTIWQCFIDSRRMPGEKAKQAMHYIASSVENIVLDFAASLHNQEESAERRLRANKPRASDARRAPCIPTISDKILKSVYSTPPPSGSRRKKRILAAPLSSTLTDEELEEFEGDWVNYAINLRPGDDDESVKVLLVHGRRAELEALIDSGHFYGCLSNFFTGGLQHILKDYVMYYIVLNQMLLHGWNQSQCINWKEDLEKDIRAGIFSAKGLSHYNATGSPWMLPKEYQMGVLILEVFKEVCDVHEYRLNKKSKAYTAFRKKVSADEVQLQDVRDFCKEQLFPQLVLGAYIYWYNTRRHGFKEHTDADDRDSGTRHPLKTRQWDVYVMVMSFLDMFSRLPDKNTFCLY